MTEIICNTVSVGHEGITCSGERFVVTERIKKSARIKFLDQFGGEVVRQATAVKRGAIKNPYEIVVYGVGRHGQVNNYTHKEKEFWKRICKRYSEGRLPHFNPRWLVLEFWLEDTRKLRDYDLFLCRKQISIVDPFGRYDRIDHLKVYERDIRTKGVVVVDLFSQTYELYSSFDECAYEVGYHRDTIFDYCHQQAIRDGYQYYWASDYGELYFD